MARKNFLDKYFAAFPEKKQEDMTFVLQFFLNFCSKKEKSMLLFIHNFIKRGTYERKKSGTGTAVFLSGR